LFFLLGATILVGEILATPLAAFMMSWTPWLPSLVGLGIGMLSLVTASFLPETKVSKPSKSTAMLSDEDGNETPMSESDLGLGHSPKASDWNDVWRQRWKDAKEHNLLTANMVCVASAVLLSSVGTSSIMMATQYASVQFSWSIARASLLKSLKGCVNLVCLLVALPYLSQLLSRRMPPAVKDLRIAQGSVLCETLGFILMAFAAEPSPFVIGICVQALGSGYYAALRSLANTLGTPSQIGLINTSIGFSIHFGTLIAGPVLAAAFQGGGSLGGVWSGLPFVIAAALFLVSSFLVWGIHASRIVDYVSSEQSVEDEETEPTACYVSN
jgi:hypothetical protein